MTYSLHTQYMFHQFCRHFLTVFFYSLLLQKLTRRTLALDKIGWSRGKKDEMAEVLTEDYMSSGDTAIDKAGKSVNSVKESWESRKLIKKKEGIR